VEEALTSAGTELEGIEDELGCVSGDRLVEDTFVK
jgi:hypothetical protein